MYRLLIVTFGAFVLLSFGKPEGSDIYFQHGLDEAKAGNLPAAIGYFDQAIQQSPNTNYYYFHRGNAKLKLEDFNGAKSDFTKSLNIKPTFDAYFCRGKAEVELGQISLAEQDFEAAYMLRPDDMKLNFYMGAMRYRDKDWNSCVEHMAKVVSKSKNNSEAYLLKGVSEYELGDYKAAKFDLQNSILHDDRQSDAYYYLSKIYESEGSLSTAIQYMGMSVELNVGEPKYLAERAELYKKNGQLDKACYDAEQAAEIGGPDLRSSYCN